MALKRIAFTICNYGYLFYALECERSFVEHHSNDWAFFIVLVDHPRLTDEQLANIQGLLASPQSRVVAIPSIFKDSREVSAMSLYYDITEYSTSVKPWAFDYLFGEYAPQSATYIDPDIQFFGSLDPDQLFESGRDCDCVVTPHVLTDSLNSYQHPTLHNIRSCGSYNFGFVHFENTARSRKVIAFWARQLVFDSLNWLEENLFTDQRFGDLFPSICSVWVNRNPALNVAYWNTQERLVHHGNDDRIYVRLLGDPGLEFVDFPLIFFHFSGLKLTGSIGISKYGGRDPRSPRGGNKTIERLARDYQQRVDGHMQRLAALRIQPEQSFIGTLRYDAHGQTALYALKPQERRDLNRFFAARSSVGMAMLPSSRFLDEDAFLMALHGVTGRTSTPVHRPQYNIFGALGFQLPGLDFDEMRSGAPIQQVALAELNVVGYPNFSFGVGRITGLILRGLSRAGISFSFTADPAKAMPILEADLAWVESLLGLSRFNPEAPSLFLINADQLLHYVNTGVASHCFSRVCNLGYWWWELESPVPAHAEAAMFLDKVLAPTRFIYESLGRLLPSEKLIYAPLDYSDLFDAIVAESGQAASALSSQDFLFSLGLDLNLECFKSLTLSVFDFRSCVKRKNPELLLDIFSDANMQDQALILKSSGGAAFPIAYQRLIERVASLSNVYLLDRMLSESDLRRLFATCQVYASPHRSEGLGLNVIEADAYGLATVFTDYGGITDYPFFGRGPHCPAPYALVKIHSASEVYLPYLKTMSDDVRWAEPDRQEFARCLRECLLASAEPGRTASTTASWKPSHSASIIAVLDDLLSTGVPARAAYQGAAHARADELYRSPAALAVVPTLADAKRQLYLACRQLLLTGRQGVVASRHLFNVMKLVVWLLLRQRQGVRRLYRAVAVRRHYVRRPPSFRKLDVPPV